MLNPTNLALALGTPAPGFGYPAGAILAAVESALAADEQVNVTTVSPDTQNVQGSLKTTACQVVAAPTITNNGTAGATTYTYKIVAKQGKRPVPASAAGSTTTGNATLTGTNSNTITFTCVPYATTYDIYRTAGGSTQGKIGSVSQPAAVVNAFLTSVSVPAATTAVTVAFLDTGLTGDATTAPTVNLTGSLQTAVSNDLNVVALSAPGTPTIGVLGTAGSTSYSYVVTAVNSVGEAPSTAGSTTTGNATLTTTNSNLITWNDVPGAQAYNVYRSASSGTPGTTGLIGTVYPNGAATFSLNDTGIVVITTYVPTVNTTGGIKTAGPIFSAGPILGGVPVADATAGNATLTVAAMLAPVLVRSGGAGSTDTTPTAAQIIAGISGATAGMGWLWSVRNARTGTATLGQAATGITWAAGTNTVATVSGHLFFIQITNATPGSEAITITSIVGSVAY